MGVLDNVEGNTESISDKLQNFDPSQIFSFFDTGIGVKIWMFVKIFIYFAVVVFIGIFAYKSYFQYNVLVTLKTRVGGGGVEKFETRGKVINDEQNKRKLILMKRINKKQLTCPVPSSEFKQKFGKKDHYEVWLDDNFQLHPISLPEVDFADAKLRVRPQERDAWARYEDKLLIEKFQKKEWLEKYLPAGILIVAMVTAFLIWFFASKELGTGLRDLATQFAQIASSCTKLG